MPTVPESMLVERLLYSVQDVRTHSWHWLSMSSDAPPGVVQRREGSGLKR